MKEPISQMLTVKQFATLTGIAESTIRLWLREKILSPMTLSKGDLQMWLREAIAHIKTQAIEADDDLRLARIRETTARAEKLERENRLAEDELCLASDVVATWSSAFNVCKNRFLGLAVTLADDLEGTTDKAIAKEIIQDAIEEILEELGSGGILRDCLKSRELR
jgi:DNA-binding transcriptional MerR regulator